MTESTITKTIIQHTEVLPEETMQFLRGIAEDYTKVRNYVYQRYCGIKNVNRLTPVYNVLNEMRECGLRTQLKLPVVYYELAVADAVADIKGNWGILKNRINEQVSANENLSAEEKMYIRTVLRINSTFSAILNREAYEIPEKVKGLSLDIERLNNRIRRMVRKYHTMPKTEQAQMFRVSPNGFRYRDGGIYLVSRIPRHRVFVPLTSDEKYKRQIRFELGENRAILNIPVETKIQNHEDYTNTLYVHVGNREMFTLSNGNVYGEKLEEIVFPETLRLDQKNQERGGLYRKAEYYKVNKMPEKAIKIEINNLGRAKYDRQKKKERKRTTDYINTEINRMIREEKPFRIVIPKPVTKGRTKHYSRIVNMKLNRNFQSYIRRRLAFKCQLHSIELIEINSKGTGTVCSNCGAEGKRWRRDFMCGQCGNHIAISLNSARNLEKKFVKEVS